VRTKPQFVQLDEDTTASREGWSANAEAVLEVRRMITTHANEKELFDMLLATVANGEKLWSYSSRQEPELPLREKWKTYRRLRSGRLRVIGELRARLAHGVAQKRSGAWPFRGIERKAA
jgi:hypothetical protein